MIGRAVWSQFLTFSAVGVLNTGIHYVVFVVLLRTAHMDYLLASTIGYVCGLVNSYFMNSRWTFESGTRPRMGEVMRFSLVNVASLGVNASMLYLTVTRLGASPESGQVAAIVTSMALNFLGNRLWTFRPVVLTR